MGRSFYIITGLIGFLAGVAVYLVYQPDLIPVFTFLVFALAGLAVLFWWQKRTQKTTGVPRDELRASRLRINRRTSAGTPDPVFPLFSFSPLTRFVSLLRSSLFCFCLFFIFLCLGLMRGGLAEHRVTPEQIDYYNGNFVEIEGVIVETDVRRDKSKYTVKTDTLFSSRAESRDPSQNYQITDADQQKARDSSTLVGMKKNVNGSLLITLSINTLNIIMAIG
jgi:hypothetical protein